MQKHSKYKNESSDNYIGFFKNDVRAMQSLPEDKEELDNEEDFVPEIETRQCVVSVEQHYMRLDRYLVEMVPEFSRNYLQKLIADQAITVDGQVQTKASLKVKVGQNVAIELRPTPDILAFRPENVPLDIVYEDEYLLVLNKPAGMVVHPAMGHWSGTLLNGLLYRFAQAKHLPRAGIVHRLDKDTTGLLLVGKTLQAYTALVAMIMTRQVHREYIALAHGQWEERFKQEFRPIQTNIGRDPRLRIKMAVLDKGKPAHTDVFFVDGNTHYSLIRCVLHTGRTHQIRVHLSFVGHPLVGDTLYGGSVACGMSTQGLHAWQLSFCHPMTGEMLSFKQKWPENFQEAVKMVILDSTFSRYG